DPARLRKDLRELLGNDKAWQGYIELQELQHSIAKLIWPSFLKPLKSREKFASSCANQLQKRAWRAFVEHPVGDILEELIPDSLLRGTLLTDAKIGISTFAHDPLLHQNRCYLLHTIGREEGHWSVPLGGMGTLTSELVRRCLEVGVEIATSAEVMGIDLGAKQHTVTFEIENQQESVDAQYVVHCAGMNSFTRLLPEIQTNELNRSSTRAQIGTAVKVNMLLKKLPRPKCSHLTAHEMFAGSCHIFEDYEQLEISYRQSEQGHVPVPQPADIYCHSLTDPSILGPSLRALGYQTLTLFGLDMRYDLFASDNSAVKSQVLQGYLEGLNEYLVDPIESCLAIDAHGKPCIEILSPVDIEEKLTMEQGNIFHSELSWFYASDSSQTGKWGVETDFPRIFLGGSSAQRGGAVSGIPGHNAAACILRFD
ncbi:MAG: NAD(P)/FAD-dependent oxidoreductase, partial [Planctomycetales bacterium]|nr:NAD(P)/FAD-dependent oxidoreductase [Planctomycetales bacterium]